MSGSAKRAISNVVTVLAAGVVALVALLILAQTRTLGEDIKQQTLINQRYLRCILLIPSNEFTHAETRVKAIDRCARDSFLPGGAPSGQPPKASAAPTSDSQQASSGVAADPDPRSEAPQSSPDPDATGAAPGAASGEDQGLASELLEQITGVLGL